MKKMLFAGILFVCMLPVYAFPQSPLPTLPAFPLPQHITILPPSIASAINCCVLPFNRVFVSRLTEIIWDNQSESEVRLTIGKGTDCKEVSMEDQLPYVIESIVTCHIIQNIPQGKTRSVRFTDPGQYDYTIEYLGKLSKPEAGSITVF
jgi:hypothetical protein